MAMAKPLCRVPAHTVSRKYVTNLLPGATLFLQEEFEAESVLPLNVMPLNEVRVLCNAVLDWHTCF